MTFLSKNRPSFLASVTTAAEAVAALEAGADIIDCKDPATGALGALGFETVRAIVKAVAGRAPVSATIGDDPADVAAAIDAMAQTGVDAVKLPATALKPGFNASGVTLVAVFMADRDPNFAQLEDLATYGFAGAMLDTAGKSAGTLRSALEPGSIKRFVDTTHAHKMFAGLAGSLSITDIRHLAPFAPDLLGFRGALCAAGRTGALEPARVRAIAREIRTAALHERPAA